MVMKPEPWAAALTEVTADPPDGASPRLIVPSPSGRQFTQTIAQELAAVPWLVFACGRYEGIDARVSEWAAERMPVDELSLGDYVLNGGEVAVLTIVEAVARLLPGFMGNPESIIDESHAAGTGGLLEYPVYTKPPTWEDRAVPEVLLSGHHGRVARWRRDQALARTAARRPDLITGLDPATLNAKDRSVLRGLGWLPSDDGRFRPAGPAVAN